MDSEETKGLMSDEGNPKTKYGKAKPPLHLILTTAMLHAAQAQKEGDEKYGRANWRDQPVSASTYVGAALRHLFKWWNGEDTDPSSGANHLGHVMTNMSIILDACHNDMLIDDRPTPCKEMAKLFDDLTEDITLQCQPSEPTTSDDSSHLPPLTIKPKGYR